MLSMIPQALFPGAIGRGIAKGLPLQKERLGAKRHIALMTFDQRGPVGWHERATISREHLSHSEYFARNCCHRGHQPIVFLNNWQ